MPAPGTSRGTPCRRNGSALWASRQLVCYHTTRGGLGASVAALPHVPPKPRRSNSRKSDEIEVTETGQSGEQVPKAPAAHHASDCQ